MTSFQGQLVVLKVMLEDAKNKLSEREWAALRACLHIYLAAEDEKERWPCGCVKGETPHGPGWADCELRKGKDEKAG